MIRVAPGISIPEEELKFTFVRSSGPGGQNVNKVATAVQLRFALDTSPSLTPEIRQRLRGIAGRRISADGVLVIRASRHRSQERNREDAISRFIELLGQAAVIPVRRQKTRTPRAEKRRRLETKQRRATIKQARRRPELD